MIGLVKEMNDNLDKQHIDGYVENPILHQIEER